MKIVQFNGHTYLLKDESFKEQPYNTKGCLDKHNIFCLGTTGYNRPRLECISGFCEDCHEIIASTRDIPNCEKLEVMDYPENFIVDNVGRKISIDGIYRNINEHHHALDMNELVQVTGFVLIDGHCVP